MKPYFTRLGLLLISAAFTLSVQAQTTTCLDVADEPHHQLLYSNHDVRVFLLELPRLASTEPHCHAHSYFYVVTGEGRSSTTPEGHATFSHDWRGGETRFVYSPAKHVIRNEGINPYREVVVESLRQVQYRALDGNYDTDELAGDLGSTKPTWTISAVRGPLAVSKTQLAPGADTTPQGAGQVLIALTDLQLKREREGMPAQTVELNAQEVRVLSGDTLKLTNTSPHSAKFITVEF
jgi:hypothetical protein